MNHTEALGGRSSGAGPSSFASIIGSAIAEHRTSERPWTMERDEGSEKVWIRVSRDGQVVPEQGWKLHISAASSSSRDVLRRALEVLLQEEGCVFKVAEEHVLEFLNSGDAGLTQVGKFITVYPSSDERAVRLAAALHAATKGLRGPSVPFENSVARESLVHYRYGSFIERIEPDQSGSPIDVVTNAEGELVPDDSSRKHDWVVDPFAAAGLSCPPSSRVIGGRFPLTATLHSSAAGGVYLSVDSDSGRTVVLKRARRDTRMTSDGRDARDHLREEANVLELLQPDERFPRAEGLVEHEGDLYLLMNHIPGSLLGDYLNALNRAGRVLDNQSIIDWGLELAAALERIHSEDLVYRDLNPANVIVTQQGNLRLVDFGAAVRAGDDVSGVPVGTRGFISEQQSVGEPPSLADDVYAFGAMLYFLGTGADPALAPDALRLTSRPAIALNPSLSPGLDALIHRCLAELPQDRPQSMAEVAAALNSTDKERSSSGLAEAITEDPDEVFRARCLENARRLGDTICAVAFPPEGAPLSDFGIPTTIAGGIAGPLLALAELVEAFDDADHRLVLEETALRVQREGVGEQADGEGLYTGASGRGAALLRAGQVTRNQALIESAAAIGERVSESDAATPDLFGGVAGRALFHLLLADETGEDQHLAAAVGAGDWLVENARREGHEAYWDSPGKALTGWAHGAAGVGDVLLDLFEVTGNERFADIAIATARWLERLQVPIGRDRDGIVWREKEKGPRAGTSWRAGAAGIGRFFVHLAELGLLEEAESVVRGAANAVALRGRTATPSQAEGLSGAIEFLLDAAGAPGGGSFAREAITLGRLLETWATEVDGFLAWRSDKPDVFTPEYLSGNSGVAICLLRLGDPDGHPYQLSRKGFRSMSRIAKERWPA